MPSPTSPGWQHAHLRPSPPGEAGSTARVTGGAPGFTLIEVLVSLAIFTVGLVGVGAMVVTAQRGAAVDEARTRADLLAQSILEEVTAAARLPGAFSPTGDLHLDPLRVATWRGQASTLPGGTLALKLAPLGDVPGSRLTLTLAWRAGGDTPRRLTVTARLAAP